MSAESQRVCANCGHQKRGHEFPRSEGGHGGGDSGRCVVYSCGCRGFKSTDEFKEQEYTGSTDLPKWVAEGVRVRVKKTPHIRQYGIGSGDHKLWGGEIGVIERQDGTGWWDWSVKFPHGISARLNERLLEDIVKAKR